MKSSTYISGLILFLFLNFGGLGIGSIWTTPGVISDWYLSLDNAPWRPPGWVFGFAWTTIGVTFSMLMAYNYMKKDIEPLLFFIPSLALNILWNIIFFELHWLWFGVGILISLSTLIFTIIDFNRYVYGWKVALWGLPYFVWLMIALSINIYIAIQN